MDLVTIVLILIGLCAAAAGKIAAAKRRSVLRWAFFALFTGPIAPLCVWLLRHLSPCRSCGNLMVIAPGRRCKACGWTLPPKLERAQITSSLRGSIGFSLGDTEQKIDAQLEKRGIIFKRTPDDEILWTQELYGHIADITVSLASGRAQMLTASYPIDKEFAIYRHLKKSLVAEFGRPAYDNRDAAFTDNWNARDLLVSLSGSEDPRTPATVVVFQRLSGKLERSIKDAIDDRSSP